jgi:hypothetical protein
MGRLTSAVAKRRRCRRSVPLCFFMRSIQSGTLRLHDNPLSYDLYGFLLTTFPSVVAAVGPGSQRARVLRDLLRPGGYSREQRDEPLCHGGMCEDSLTQRGIGQSCKHRDLDDRDDFSRLRSESSEPKNAITLGIDESFQKTSSLT